MSRGCAFSCQTNQWPMLLSCCLTDWLWFLVIAFVGWEIDMCVWREQKPSGHGTHHVPLSLKSLEPSDIDKLVLVFCWHSHVCDLKCSNNPDPSHNFLSTPTTKSAVPVDTDHVSMGVQSRPPPALTSQSMTKEPAQNTKLPQILPVAMFAQLMSNWKHCEDQQKEIVFYLFPEHQP